MKDIVEQLRSWKQQDVVATYNLILAAANEIERLNQPHQCPVCGRIEITPPPHTEDER
jgi:hypothetical protein